MTSRFFDSIDSALNISANDNKISNSKLCSDATQEVLIAYDAWKQAVDDLLAIKFPDYNNNNLVPKNDNNNDDNARTIKNNQQYSSLVLPSSSSISSFKATDVTQTPPPVIFTGKKSSDCGPFFSRLSLIFAANPSKFATDRDKIIYAISHMTGNAFQFFKPYYVQLLDNPSRDALPKTMPSYFAFKKTVIVAFGGSNNSNSSSSSDCAGVDAETCHRNLKQTSTVSEYATIFKKLSLEVNWNSADLISQYKLNLKENVKRALLRHSARTTLESLISLSIEIDENLLLVDHSSSSNNGKDYNHHHPYNNNKDCHPSSSPTTLAVPSNSSKNKNFTSLHHQKSNTDTNTKLGSNGHLTQAERQQRVEGGLCLYCGSSLHYIQNCGKRLLSSTTFAIIDKQQQEDYHHHHRHDNNNDNSHHELLLPPSKKRKL